MTVFQNIRTLLSTNGRDDQPDTLAPLSKEHRARAELFDLYWNYYRGKHRPNLKVKPGKVDDNVILNWSKKVVNRGVAFLFGRIPTFEIDGEERNESNRPVRSDNEKYLDAIWQADPITGFSPGLFLQSLAQNGAICGTAFIRIYPASEIRPKIKLACLDPRLMDIKTMSSDVDVVEEYHVIWKTGKGVSAEWMRHRFVRETAESWLILSEQYKKQGNWAMIDEPEEWPYDFAPVFHCHNLNLANSAWGMSDLEDADINDAINFTASNINRILRFHAHPRTVGTGMEANDLKTTAVDQLWTVPTSDAEIFNLEMQSDLGSSRQHKQDLEEAFHQVTNIPRLDPRSVNLGALSGFALQILNGPLLDKTAVKQLTYGGMLQQINRALLLLGEKEEVTVNNVWPNPLPTADSEKADVMNTLTSAGASVYASAKVAGYSEEQARLLASNNTESAAIE